MTRPSRSTTERARAKLLFLLSSLLLLSLASASAPTPTLSDDSLPAPTITNLPAAAAQQQLVLGGVDEVEQHDLAKRQTISVVTSSTVSIPGTAAAGGLSYTEPAITAAVSYYKIMSNNPITFGWNYTSLYVTPSALTFVAYCSANSFTYPVGPTTGISGANTQIVWDPYAYQQSANAIPFAQASYTLRVFDERGIDAIATAGMFYGANSIVNFAMYSPAAYTPLAEGWKCVACSAGLSRMSEIMSSPLVVALPVTVALILIGGAGVFNR